MPVQGDHEGNARERDWCRYKATNTKLTRERPRRSSQESGRRLSRSGAGVAKITRIRIRIHPDLTKISPTCKLSHSPTVPTGQAKQGVPRPPKIRQACKAMSSRALRVYWIFLTLRNWRNSNFVVRMGRRERAICAGSCREKDLMRMAGYTTISNTKVTKEDRNWSI